MQRPVLAIVPARDEAPAEVAPLAVVYRLPVADQANVYRRRRLAALAIVAGLVLGVVSFMQQADATPTPKASSPSRSASSCSPATPCGVSQAPWHRRVIPEHSSTSSAILPVDPRFSLANSSWCRPLARLSLRSRPDVSGEQRVVVFEQAIQPQTGRDRGFAPVDDAARTPPTRWGEIERQSSSMRPLSTSWPLNVGPPSASTTSALVPRAQRAHSQRSGVPCRCDATRLVPRGRACDPPAGSRP